MTVLNKNSPTEQILKKAVIKNSSKFYLHKVREVRYFITKVLQDKPDYILGLGTYSRNSKNILIEKYCSNIFRGKIYGKRFEKLPIPNFLDESAILKLSDSIGTSYCNYVSYLLTALINQNPLKTKYSFLHFSKKLEVIS